MSLVVPSIIWDLRSTPTTFGITPIFLSHGAKAMLLVEYNLHIKRAVAT